ncbi:hypothetical protein LMG29542_07585 [Paraburkholderia humisilvae]|uniref:Uncharacterized protein n=1 Tax=Paraburkholderia humisilvae TaxID=627669 RepID=A0A6J5FA76_9BURK|nr:hypothetical protein LMG29542_07585 [Paraburkholderia humisilvae]
MACLRSGAVRVSAGLSVLYQPVPRLQEDVRIRHGSGAFGKWLIQLARINVVILMIGV